MLKRSFRHTIWDTASNFISLAIINIYETKFFTKKRRSLSSAQEGNNEKGCICSG
ncbi:hypothetical protein STSP1_00393 [Sedimentisphaera salicampi]|uniref:Uncharacterized protein n=1 Tax=Sedimentisphaera salicampi TaxID=1941349 RepID=A0A1W6LJV5_9BACT|nr:hypothetical protein STSP1_00393 [Sedimentisphaera salicampi]